MRLFLSWSGQLSRDIAELLYRWLPGVIQAVKPWMSTEDIPPGSLWSNEVTVNLSTAGAGVICVTQDNVAAPWLNFEAGALAKQLDQLRVAVALLAVRSADIQGPLTMFQHTPLDDQKEVFKLVRMLNEACVEPLDEGALQNYFVRDWPKLAAGVANLAGTPAATVPPPRRSAEDILAEVLEGVRETHRLLTQRPTGPEIDRPDLAAFDDDSGVDGVGRVFRAGMRVRHPVAGCGLVVGIDRRQRGIGPGRLRVRVLLDNTSTQAAFPADDLTILAESEGKTDGT